MIAPALVLAGHQPAYPPWPGYLSRLLDVDRFLLLDHVQYSRGWQHRNYYLDFAALAEAGIGVQIATYSHPPYARGRQPFIPGLSALDLLLHQGPGGRRILSHGGQLTTWTGAIPA